MPVSNGIGKRVLAKRARWGNVAENAPAFPVMITIRYFSEVGVISVTLGCVARITQCLEVADLRSRLENRLPISLPPIFIEVSSY